MKTYLTKKVFRDLVKERVQSEMRVLKARIRLAKAKNNYDARVLTCIEQHGYSPNNRLLGQMKHR